MNFWIYFGLTTIITVFFLVSFIKQRKAFQLSFSIWMASSLLQYLKLGKTFYNIFCVVEIVLFVLSIALLIKEQRDRKKNKEHSDA